MKAADNLAARLAGNMRESMGAAPVAVPTPAVLHGGAAKYQGAARLKDALSIRIDQIVADPNQPRKEFDRGELDDLAASLKDRGQLQPIRVRWDDSMTRWVIIAGERRFRAAQIAGLASLICIEATAHQADDEILQDQLVENCLRSDLKPVEQARAFRTLIALRGWSYRQLGATLHISSAHITRSMALLDLPEDVQARVDSGEVPASSAAEVAKIEGDEQRREIVGRIAAGELTRDQVVKTVRERAPRPSGKPEGRGSKPRKVTERSFRTTAGPRVSVEFKRGLSPALILAALVEAVEQARGAMGEVAA